MNGLKESNPPGWTSEMVGNPSASSPSQERKLPRIQRFTRVTGDQPGVERAIIELTSGGKWKLTWWVRNWAGGSKFGGSREFNDVSSAAKFGDGIVEEEAKKPKGKPEDIARIDKWREMDRNRYRSLKYSPLAMQIVEFMDRAGGPVKAGDLVERLNARYNEVADALNLLERDGHVRLLQPGLYESAAKSLYSFTLTDEAEADAPEETDLPTKMDILQAVADYGDDGVTVYDLARDYEIDSLTAGQLLNELGFNGLVTRSLRGIWQATPRGYMLTKAVEIVAKGWMGGTDAEDARLLDLLRSLLGLSSSASPDALQRAAGYPNTLQGRNSFSARLQALIRQGLITNLGGQLTLPAGA